MRLTRILFPMLALGAAVFAPVNSLRADESAGVQGKAIVAAVLGSGQASYSTDHGATWTPLPVNQELTSGAAIKTQGDATVDLFVNGVSSIRVTRDSEVAFDTLSRTGSSAEMDTTTLINLKSGTVLGNARKLSQASSYGINTPQGLARIHGTQFLVTARPTAADGFQVTFTCVRDLIYVDATTGPGGSTVTQALLSGETWTPGQQPQPIPAGLDIIDQIAAEIAELLQNIQNNPNPGLHVPGPTIIAGIITSILDEFHPPVSSSITGVE